VAGGEQLGAGRAHHRAGDQVRGQHPEGLRHLGRHHRQLPGVAGPLRFPAVGTVSTGHDDGHGGNFHLHELPVRASCH